MNYSGRYVLDFKFHIHATNKHVNSIIQTQPLKTRKLLLFFLKKERHCTVL